MSLSINEVSLAYEDIDGSGFKIRGLEYMKNKMKVCVVSHQLLLHVLVSVHNSVTSACFSECRLTRN